MASQHLPETPLPQGMLETGLRSVEGGKMVEGNCVRELDWRVGGGIFGGKSCDWVGCGGECVGMVVLLVMVALWLLLSFWEEPV